MSQIEVLSISRHSFYLCGPVFTSRIKFWPRTLWTVEKSFTLPQTDEVSTLHEIILFTFLMAFTPT